MSVLLKSLLVLVSIAFSSKQFISRGKNMPRYNSLVLHVKTYPSKTYAGVLSSITQKQALFNNMVLEEKKSS